MKNRIVAVILVMVLSLVSIIPCKKASATVVGTEVVIEVGTVLYYIIQGVITGAEVKTLVEVISLGETQQIYKKSDGSSSSMYKFINTKKYRIKPAVSQALVDGLTDKQLVEISNNVSTRTDGSLSTGAISDSTKKAVNGIMIDVSNNVSMYDKYYTQLVQKRKELNAEQLAGVRDIINQFAYDNRDVMQESDYKYPYFAIVPTISLYSGAIGYRIYMSTVPLIVHNSMGRVIDIAPVTDAMSGIVVGSKNCAVRPKNNAESFYIYTYYYDWLLQFGTFSNPNYLFPYNAFLRYDITAIGHGIIDLDYETYSKLYDTGSLTWEEYERAQNNVYQMPYSLAEVDKDYTYLDKEKTEMVIADESIDLPSADADEVIDNLIDIETSDKDNHLTWDNTQSEKSKLISNVLDGGYIDIPVDTPTDLSGVNKKLDDVIEKLGAIVGSIGNINALTDAQLREALKDLDLANTDGLTIDQVRDYATERELAQEKELENELNIDNYKVDQGIITKFPFCIPFDLINMVKKLKRTGVAPRFEVPFKINSIGIDEVIVFDFKDYEPVVVVVRWFVLFGFVGSLILVTRKLIRG